MPLTPTNSTPQPPTVGETTNSASRPPNHIAPLRQPNPSRSPDPSTASVDGVCGLIRLSEPRRLFRGANLKLFQECGGFGDLNAPAAVSVFNSEEDTFVTLFPEKRRIYLFDTFGGLREKHSSDSTPLSLVWRDHRAEYLIGFADSTIGRYSARLKVSRGRFRLPEGFVPHRIVSAARDVFVSDGGSRLVRITPDDQVQLCGPVDAPVSDLRYSAARDCLVLSTPKALVGLRRDGGETWRAPHSASAACVACAPNGDIWAALSTGQLVRLVRSGQAEQQKVVDVPLHARSSVRTLVALDQAVVAGSEKGELVLFDRQGREIGRDDLKARLDHLVTGEGNILVASTGLGPCVLKPNPSVLFGADQAELGERALRTVTSWEAQVANGVQLVKVFREFFQYLDLVQWPEVLAHQLAVLLRKRTNPVAFRKIEDAMERVDPRKAACLCTQTRPVFIDGSNVSRDHWKGSKDPGRRSRLAAILDMQNVLTREANPVLYPLITVVDLNERRWVDDHAGLVRLIDEEQILETPSAREADALILNFIRQYDWLDCEIVSNDKRMFEDHQEMLPEANQKWYEKVRRAFVIQPRTSRITFVSHSW